MDNIAALSNVQQKIGHQKLCTTVVIKFPYSSDVVSYSSQRKRNKQNAKICHGHFQCTVVYHMEE